jgi:hypothetical protein
MCLMSLRRIQVSAVVIIFFTLFLASGLAQHTVRDAVVRASETTKPSSIRPAANWIFEGCWTQFAAGPCRDVFRDQEGNYWICRDCGSTGNPGPGKCSPISQATLARGFWCS